MSDVVGGITDACSDQNFGQTEDYGVTFIDPSSISEDRKSLVHLYPNPANNLLNIKALDGQLIDQLTIIDITGRIVEQNESSNNSLANDVSHLISGHYFVVLRIAQDNIVIPFIKL